jgi:hypothetical protein
MSIKNNRDDSAGLQGISRREFLKLASVTAVGLLVGCDSAQQAEATLALINGTLMEWS